ncbi:hypothetical protein FKW77_005309 [Venturia effusa]|uniref:Histone chaperone domain-containing protein n=1 Tax=Venturia effusa TaxID=50376 RepID=A0A517KZH0_9PEZI|nr:hypothetical protein FKW77_005309 [Venturia effusa]
MSAPAGEGINDNDYKSRTGQSEIPVVGNDSAVESGVNPDTEDSDATLEKDDKEAIDESNIVEGRTRGAAKQNYAEPGDEEGLPGPEDGTSRGAQ